MSRRFLQEERAVATADGRPAFALTPTVGADPPVVLVRGTFNRAGPRPYRLWLQDEQGNRSGWTQDGDPVQAIPESEI